MKTVKLWRNGNFIIVNAGSDKEKALRKEGWSDKKQQPKEAAKPDTAKPADTNPQNTPNAAS